MLVFKDARDMIINGETNLKYYPKGEWYPNRCRCRWDNSPPVKEHPQNIKEIISAIDKVNYSNIFDEMDFDDAELKERYEALVPGMFNCLSKLCWDSSQTMVWILASNFAIEFDAYEETLLYDDSKVHIEVTGFIADENLTLDKVEKHIELLQKLEDAY